MFQNEADVLDYIERNKLQSAKPKDDKEKKILDDLQDLINNYFSGTNIDLFEKIKTMDVELDLREKFESDFSYGVIQSLLKTKPGKVRTYSEIGEMIGSKGYRAIGNVLRNNPLPLIIPCHRIVRKNGDVGGFGGVNEASWETNLKKELLTLEGYKI